MPKIAVLAAAVLAGSLAAAAAFGQQPALTGDQMKVVMKAGAEGARTWAALCESCHGPPNPNTPPRTALLAMTADHIYETLTTGKMKMAGDTISDSEKRSVSMYLTGKVLTVPPAPAQPAPAQPAPAQPAPPVEAAPAPTPAG